MMTNTTKKAAISLFFILLFLFCLFGLGSALVPLLISFALSYLLFPLIRKLELKGLKRIYAVNIVFFIVVILLGLIFAFTIPGLVKDAQSFLSELPSNTTKVLNHAEQTAARFGYSIEISKETIATYVKNHVKELSGSVLKSVSFGLKNAFKGFSNWLITILNIFLIPLFFFYLINDYENITKSIKSFIPKTLRPKLDEYLALANDVMSGYIRGQFLVALTLACLYAIGLSLVGLRFGFLIGVFSGLISIIPYAGATLGIAAALLVALANFTGMGLIIGIVIVFAVVQAFEGMIITPKLVGDKVGLSALVTMLALIIGGNLFGLVGMLIAIPCAALIKTLALELKKTVSELD